MYLQMRQVGYCDNNLIGSRSGRLLQPLVQQLNRLSFVVEYFLAEGSVVKTIHTHSRDKQSRL